MRGGHSLREIVLAQGRVLGVQRRALEWALHEAGWQVGFLALQARYRSDLSPLRCLLRCYQTTRLLVLREVLGEREAEGFIVVLFCQIHSLIGICWREAVIRQLLSAFILQLCHCHASLIAHLLR